jgi:hypothetical protein
VGARPEPADERQIHTAVSNAHNLYDAIQKRREQIRADEPFGHS